MTRPVRPLLPFALLAALAAPARPAFAVEKPSFLDQVEAHFAEWDRDLDGKLSPEEVDRAVADAGNRGPAAAAVAALDRATRARRGTPLPPLTLGAIRDLAGQARPGLPGMFADASARIRDSSGRGLFARGGPRLDTIHQGRLGNCFCLAPLGAMVHRDPDAVARMFRPRPDGSYEVKLGDRAVVVAAPTDAELALTSSNERDGTWINLYEKAVGEALKSERAPKGAVLSPIDALARGGSAGTMLAFLTGHPIERFSCRYAVDPKTPEDRRRARTDELRARLAGAFAAGRLVTCGTLKTTTPGLTPNHAYAVLGFDAGADSIRLWNPHGGSFQPKGDAGPERGYARADGVFTMPLGEFVRQFSGLAFEVVRPDPARPGP